MGRLLKLVVVAAVLWAVWHVGAAQWQQFVFQDDLKQIAQFGANGEEESVRAAVMKAAAIREIPLTPERVQVRKQGEWVYIDASYTIGIEILPRYRYPWVFTASAQAWFVPGSRFPTGR